MKIYIASSWKNEAKAKVLASLLLLWGHEVDCFCDASTGRYVFHFSEVGPVDQIDAISFLQDERVQKAFIEDKKHIDWSDAVVMLHPCGKSSHLEAGYAKGSGKLLFMIGDFPKGEFDVMYGFADGIFRELDELKNALGVRK
jgi:hypothetical protein